ncbi:30S ribosome-binding factor RbfA [Saccharopolyspora rectivirgula]|uniref:Ribosome-binding factor A n=1 Tax=Saccharopolyspora rectivirgula TaxID=28042 RepID=A0A073AZ86_9PSEU|nr:30S ribosome-binding factor RbfA [Saccharopolyspora rectivirgula]KEI44387.1 ribosome-binding factor A [Saccharopolyspora rectivirgula]
MADTARARRLAKRIAQIVATGLEHQVKDPRLAMVTITGAKVTPDLRDATVYYTVFGDEADQSSTAAALSRVTGFLRSMVGQQTGVRFTPTLTFVPDTVPDQARRVEELLAKAREADAEVARLASNAQPAGDPQPYRVPEEGDQEPASDSSDADEEDGSELRGGPHRA